MNQTISARQLEEAYDACGPAVYRLAMVYLGRPADAEDVTQETFVRLLCRAPAFADEEHRRRWLLRVAANECKKLLRSPWRRRTGPLDEAEEAAAFDRPAQSELFRQVMSLPPKYRAAVYLYYYEGYSVKEAGELLGAKASTVQTWLMRARGQLHTKLKEAEAL